MKKRTFADVAKPIQKRIEALKSYPKSTRIDNTLKLYEKQLDNLFAQQEQMKQESMLQEQQEFGQGGLVKYAKAGIIRGDAGLVENLPKNPSYNVDLDSQIEQGYLPMGEDTKYYSNYYMNTPNLPNKGANFIQAKEDFDNVGKEDKQDVETQPNSFNKRGQVGAVLTSGVGSFLQNKNIDKVKAPATLSNMYLTNGQAPTHVNNQSELNNINAEFKGAAEGLRLGSGSYSTQVGNLGKLRSEQLRLRGASDEKTRNYNNSLDNQFKEQVNQNAQKSQMYNEAIAKENMENKFNYDQNRALAKNSVIAQGTKTMGDVFNNQTDYQNQMEQAKVMSNSKSGTVFNDSMFGTEYEKQYIQNMNPAQKEQHNLRRQQKGLLPIAKYGGMIGGNIIDTYAEGGTTGTYHKLLPKSIAENNIDWSNQFNPINKNAEFIKPKQVQKTVNRPTLVKQNVGVPEKINSLPLKVKNINIDSPKYIPVENIKRSVAPINRQNVEIPEEIPSKAISPINATLPELEMQPTLKNKISSNSKSKPVQEEESMVEFGDPIIKKEFKYKYSKDDSIGKKNKNLNNNTADDIFKGFSDKGGRFEKDCEDGKCAEHANTRSLEIFNDKDMSKMSKKERDLFLESVGSKGNAWDNQKNIVKSGGKNLMNLYKGQPNPNIFNDLKDGDMVGLDYEDSKGNPYDDNKMTTRHQGIVRVDSNGKKYIDHKIHKKIFLDKIDNNNGTLKTDSKDRAYGQWKVISASRPAYNKAKPKELDRIIEEETGRNFSLKKKKLSKLNTEIAMQKPKRNDNYYIPYR